VTGSELVMVRLLAYLAGPPTMGLPLRFLPAPTHTRPPSINMVAYYPSLEAATLGVKGPKVDGTG